MHRLNYWSGDTTIKGSFVFTRVQAIAQIITSSRHLVCCHVKVAKCPSVRAPLVTESFDLWTLALLRAVLSMYYFSSIDQCSCQEYGRRYSLPQREYFSCGISGSPYADSRKVIVHVWLPSCQLRHQSDQTNSSLNSPTKYNRGAGLDASLSALVIWINSVTKLSH